MPSGERIRVLIADDHALLREGLKGVLELAGGFEVVGEAGDGDEAVRMARCLRPDVVIMDVMMPAKGGIEASRDIVEELPQTRVLILTASNSMNAVMESIAAGATGYLQKASSRDALLDSVRSVAAGDVSIPGNLIRRAFIEMRSGENARGVGPNALTPREREILKMFAQGMSYAEIAEKRGNRPLTIRNTFYSVQSRLGVKTKQELVVWIVRSGLLDDEWDLS